MPGVANRNRAARSRRVLAAAGMDTPTLAVSRSYLDRIVAHELALSIEKREAPPFGLLQVAETIGGADWQPARMAFGETLAGLIAEVPKAMCEPADARIGAAEEQRTCRAGGRRTILVRGRPAGRSSGGARPRP